MLPIQVHLTSPAASHRDRYPSSPRICARLLGSLQCLLQSISIPSRLWNRSLYVRSARLGPVCVKKVTAWRYWLHECGPCRYQKIPQPHSFSIRLRWWPGKSSFNTTFFDGPFHGWWRGPSLVTSSISPTATTSYLWNIGRVTSCGPTSICSAESGYRRGWKACFQSPTQTSNDPETGVEESLT